MTKPRSVLTVYIDPELHDELRKYAHQRWSSKSAAAAHIIAEALHDADKKEEAMSDGVQPSR